MTRVPRTTAATVAIPCQRGMVIEPVSYTHLDVYKRQGFTVMTTEEALEVANRIGYPVLMRPSYVPGGQNMIIAFNDADIKEYMACLLYTS